MGVEAGVHVHRIAPAPRELLRLDEGLGVLVARYELGWLVLGLVRQVDLALERRANLYGGVVARGVCSVSSALRLCACTSACRSQCTHRARERGPGEKHHDGHLAVWSNHLDLAKSCIEEAAEAAERVRFALLWPHPLREVLDRDACQGILGCDERMLLKLGEGAVEVGAVPVCSKWAMGACGAVCGAGRCDGSSVAPAWLANMLAYFSSSPRVCASASSSPLMPKILATLGMSTETRYRRTSPHFSGLSLHVKYRYGRSSFHSASCTG